MNRSPQPLDPESAPRVAMIISAALIGGCVTLLVVVLMIAKFQPSWLAAGPLTLASLIIAGVSLGLAVFVPRIFAASMIRTARNGGLRDPGSEAANRVATTAAMNRQIVRYALLEGAAFLCAFAILAEGSWLALAAVLVLLGAMGAAFPWPGRFEAARDNLRESLR